MTPRRKDPLRTWGARLTTGRGRLPQAELAQLIEPVVSQQTISKIENNEIQPRPALQGRIAAALGTTPDVLFPWDEYELSRQAGERYRKERARAITRRRREAVAL